MSSRVYVVIINRDSDVFYLKYLNLGENQKFDLEDLEIVMILVYF